WGAGLGRRSTAAARWVEALEYCCAAQRRTLPQSPVTPGRRTDSGPGERGREGRSPAGTERCSSPGTARGRFDAVFALGGERLPGLSRLARLEIAPSAPSSLPVLPRVSSAAGGGEVHKPPGVKSGRRLDLALARTATGHPRAICRRQPRKIP